MTMTSRTVKNPPPPGSNEWRGMITASKIPAILGVSRFTSQYTLWHEMAGRIPPTPMKQDIADWGHAAELALADWWARRQPDTWQLNAGEVAYTRDDLPFPNLATLDRRARRGRAFRILECKTARSLDDWGKPGEPDSVPADYHTQVVWQMGVSGIHQASVLVLGPFHQAEEHEIPWDADLFDGLVDVAKDWWASLQEDTPPPLDDTTSTYQTVRGLHTDINPDEEVQLTPAEAEEILTALRMEKAAAQAATAAKTRLLDRMGNAKKALMGETTIATRAATSRGGVMLRPNLKAKL